MVNRSKNIGTQAETAVVRAIRGLGFPQAERRALAGTYDLGDITGCPGVVWEVKAGAAAKTASDGQIAAWLVETETERVNAHADVAVLVTARAGIGALNADRWWAHVPTGFFHGVNSGDPVRMQLATLCSMLRFAGYGNPLDEGPTAELEQVAP